MKRLVALLILAGLFALSLYLSYLISSSGDDRPCAPGEFANCAQAEGDEK